MKFRQLALFVVIPLFILCGCASGPSKGDEMYEKYGDLIDALEAEDYETAVKAFSAYIPQPEVETITLTLDNWDEYFELLIKHDYERDAYGKILADVPWYCLSLKEEYLDRAGKIEGTIGYEYQNNCYLVTDINEDDASFVCEPAECPEDYWTEDYLQPESASSEIYRETSLFAIRFCSELKDGGTTSGWLRLDEMDQYSATYVFQPEKIDVVSFTGTLELHN